MKVLKLLLLPLGAFLFVAVTLALRLALATPPSPIAELSSGVAVAPLPPASTAVPVETAGEVKPLDALHRYAVDAVLTLTPPYAERNLESAEMRRARWTNFAIECADAVEASGVKEQVEYTLTLIFIAHRETLIAKDPFNVGNCDEGTSLGPWSMKEWNGVDRYHAAGALKLLLAAPGAWSLPSPHPWLGLAADRGKHGVNRPSVVEYMRAHPYAAD